MIIEKNIIESSETGQEDILFSELDKGIEDMEAGRILPHSNAMKKIQETVSAYAIQHTRNL